MKYEKIKDSAFYLTIILLAAILIYKIINESRIMWVFPFDYTNDWSSHMAKLFFLAKYGFYNFVPNWYDGFILFKLYAPGWFFFALPLYYITNNLQLTAYLSLLILFILGFLFINMLGKINRFSITKRVAFFLLFFANPIAIGNFIRVGKIPEMFTWVVFIPIFTIVWYYKEHEIDWKIVVFMALYSILSVSYLPGFAVGSLIVLSLLLVKPLKEKILLILAVMISLLATSFWWVNYLIESKKTMLNDLFFLEDLVKIGRVNIMENIATTLIALAFIAVFYFYWKSKNKSRKELVFFLPIIFIAVALITRIAAVLPYINKLHPDTYNFFILFITLFLFFKTEKYPKAIAKYAWLTLTIIAVASVVISIGFIAPFKENTEHDKEVVEILKYVDGKMVIFDNLESYANAYYSYSAIHYNTKSAGGWSTENISTAYRERWTQILKAFRDRNCKEFIDGLKEFKTSNVVSSDQGCETLKQCGFKEVKSLTSVCLYKM